MKIRIRGNSVRFRLSMSEVDALSTSGYVEARTVFPSGTFTYAVRVSEGATKLQADFREQSIILQLPVADGKAWNTNEVVGFQHEQPLKGGGSLALLLEKDFACLETRDEEDTDTYPNPKALPK